MITAIDSDTQSVLGLGWAHSVLGDCLKRSFKAAWIGLSVSERKSEAAKTTVTYEDADARARNPRWEPGMGMIPDPRQIGDGDGDGPPIPGKRDGGRG